MNNADKMAQPSPKHASRAVVSVLGADRPGIVAAIAQVLAQGEVNILDISQTILQGIFTMTMLVELGKESSFNDLKSQLDQISQELSVQINFQREEVFSYMYRI